jgi:hypothetical protein
VVCIIVHHCHFLFVECCCCYDCFVRSWTASRSTATYVTTTQRHLQSAAFHRENRSCTLFRRRTMDDEETIPPSAQARLPCLLPLDTLKKIRDQKILVLEPADTLKDLWLQENTEEEHFPEYRLHGKPQSLKAFLDLFLLENMANTIPIVLFGFRIAMPSLLSIGCGQKKESMKPFEKESSKWHCRVITIVVIKVSLFFLLLSNRQCPVSNSSLGSMIVTSQDWSCLTMIQKMTQVNLPSVH